MSGQESPTQEVAKPGRLNVPLFCVVGLLGCGLIAVVIHVTLFKHRVLQALVSEDQSTVVVFSSHQNWRGNSEQLTAWNLETGQHASYPIQFSDYDQRWPLPSLPLSDDGTRLLLLQSDGAARIADVFSEKSTPLPKPVGWFNTIRWIENDTKLLIWNGNGLHDLATGKTTSVDGITAASKSIWLSDRIVFNEGHVFKREGSQLQRISSDPIHGGFPVSCSPDETLLLQRPRIFAVFTANVVSIEDGRTQSTTPLTVTNLELMNPVFASNTELALITDGQAQLIPIRTMLPSQRIDFDTVDVAHAEYLLKRKQFLRVSNSGVVSVHSWDGGAQTIGRTFQSQYLMLWLSLVAVIVCWVGWTKLLPPDHASVVSWFPILGFTLAIAAIIIARAQIQFDINVVGTSGFWLPVSQIPEYSGFVGATAALSAVLMTRFCLGKDHWSLAIGWSVLCVAGLWVFMLWAMHDQFSENPLSQLSQFQFNVAVALIVFCQIGLLILAYALRFRFWHSTDGVVPERRSCQVRLSDLFLWTVGFAAMFLIGSSVHRKAMNDNEFVNLAVNGLIISAPLATFVVLMLQIKFWKRLTILVVCCVPIVAATLIAPKAFWMYSSISVTTVVLTGQVVFIAAAWSLRRAGYRLIRINRIGKTAA